MASYSIELEPTLYGTIDAADTDDPVSGSTSYPLVSDTVSTLVKFNTSALASYKKKKIIETYYRTYYIKTDVNYKKYVGGAFSWIQSTFSGSTSYQNQPPSGVAFFKYLDKTGDNAIYVFPFPYYDVGYVGYDNSPAPRSLFDQLSIGIKLSNQVKTEDRQPVYWGDIFPNGGWSNFELTRFVFSLEDWNPILTARFPISNAYINAAINNTFSLSFDAFKSIDYPTAQTITYEIKDVSTGTVTSHTASASINLKGRNYLEWAVPANTVVTGKNYQWRAKITTDDGGTAFSDWANFTTLDAAPGIPTIISPQSKYLDGATAITLTWQHNVSTGSAQHAYDLQYKQTGDWTSIVSHTVSSAQSYTVAANFFTAGQMYWRVRTYNTDDTPGDWGTSSANVVQAKPVTPIIQSITTAPRSTISWQSVGQQAYQLTVKNASGTVMQDTGEVYGTAKSKTVDLYLVDGNYTFDLTIQNGQGIWSDHAVQSVHISNSPPLGDDQLTATSQFGAVKLDLVLPNPKGVDYVGETYVGESYAAHQPYYASGTRYVLRDGEPIARITGTSYIDYTPSGTHQYAIRIVTADGNYKDTNNVSAEPIIKYACISKYNSPQNVLTLKFNQGAKPVLDRQLSKVFNSHFFAGRALPCYDVTEHHESVWSFTYSFLSRADYDTLYQLLLDGDTVMFRDQRGYKAVGTITSVKQVPSYRNINVVNFSISETDASEVIAYD